MILFSSVGHSHDRGDPTGLSDRVGALADRVRPPRLPARCAGDCTSPSEVNRSAHGAVGRQALSGKPYPCNDELSLKTGAIWGMSVEGCAWAARALLAPLSGRTQAPATDSG